MEFLPKIAGCRNFINADLIARGLSPLDVDAAVMDAGRLFLGKSSPRGGMMLRRMSPDAATGKA
jgi:predicted ABC-type ATPase